MIIWFERFTVPKLIFALGVKAVSWKTEVLYPEISFCAKKILGFLKFTRIFGWVRFYEITIGVTMKNGESLRYKAEELTNTVVDVVFKELFSRGGYIPAYLHKHSKHVHSILKSYIVSILRQKVYFLCAVDYAVENDNRFKNKERRIYFEYTPAFSIFKKVLSPHAKTSLRNWINIIFVVKENMPIQIFLALTSRVKAIFSQGKRHAKKYEELSSDPCSKIFVEFFKYRFLNSIHSHLFWFPESGISADRVIIGFDRSDSPASSKNIKLVEDYGMRWLDLRMRALHNHIRSPFFVIVKNLLKTPFPIKFFGSNIWRWKIVLEMNCFLQIWREIIKKYNIKVFHQHHEHTFISNIQSLAVGMEGGMFFWFHWSLDRYPVAHFNSGYCDVFFSWGKLHRDYIDMHNFDYIYAIDMGCMWDCSRVDENFVKETLKAQIDKSVNFIVTIFDAGSGLWTQISPLMEGYFYENMLQIVLEHKNWAGVVKSKGNRHLGFFPNSRKIKELIEELTSQKRCVLPPSYKASSLPDSAKVADVCVGLGISSPNTLVGLHGNKAIHWDLSGNTRHPYYLDGEKKIIFRKKEEITEILEKLARKEKNAENIGDHSPWFSMLDSYRDNKAGLRTGRFIESFLSAIDCGKDKDSALKDAAQIHANSWGKNTVHSFDLKKTRLHENIWLKAEKVLKR